MKKQIISCLISVLGITQVWAQTLTLLVQPPPGNTLAPTDCWNVTITNPGTSERVYLMGIILDAQGQRLSEVRSAPLWLRSGVNQFDRQSVTTARTDYVSAEAQRAVLGSGYLPKASYKICVAVLRQNDDRELGLHCLDYTATNDGMGNQKTLKKQQKVQFYGNAALEGVYGNQQGFRQTLPPSYGRLDVNPALAILGAPVTAQVHLTTEQSDSLPDLNTYTVRFDRATFQRNLQGMLMTKIQESFAARTKADAETLKRLKELDNLESITRDPTLLRELGVLDSLQKQLELIEADPQLGMDEKRQKMERVRRRLDELQAKKRQVDRLIEQRNRLLALKQDLEKTGQLRVLQNRQLEVPNLQDPAALRSQMKQYGLLAGMNRFLFGIDELALGTSFPVYSPLTMNGVQVNGGHLAWNPGVFFISATHGKTQSAWFDGSNIPTSQYEQKVSGGRLGVGKLYRNHLIVTGLRFNDQIGSINLPIGAERFAGQTTVGSTAFQVSLGKKRVFELLGEVSGLLFNRNRQDTVRLKVEEVSQYLPAWMSPNLSTGADFAWNGRAAVNLFQQRTRLIASTRFVGPGFINPGTPGLRNDVLSYDARLEQSLWRSQIRVAGGYRIESDNYSRGKGVQTLRNEMLGEVDFRFRNAPQLRVQYLKNRQENSFLTYSSDAISAYLSQNWKLGKRNRTSTNVHYLRFLNAVDSFTAAQFDAHYLYFNQMLQMGIITVSGGAQYTLAKIGGSSQQQAIVQGMVSSRLFKKAQVGIGMTWANSAQIDQKLGGQLNFQLPFSQHLLFDLAANLNQYSNVPGYAQAQVREQFVRGRLLVRW